MNWTSFLKAEVPVALSRVRTHKWSLWCVVHAIPIYIHLSIDSYS